MTDVELTQKLARQKELAKQLNKASDAYYNGEAEEMSDYEWNAKFDELASLEAVTGVVLPGSPTSNVAKDSTNGEKVRHEFPALSLAKTKSLRDLRIWADNKPTHLSWKLDGLTLVATYDKGKLVRVVTRGDGQIGTDVTHLAPGIANMPSRTKYTGKLVIRGEAVISYADFDKYIRDTGADYANPRNLASGSMNLDDVEEFSRRHVRWLPFTLVHIQDDGGMDRWGARMAFLKVLGFETVESVYCESADDIEKAVAEYTERVEHNLCEYPVDGLVLVYDDWVYSQTGSVTGHHATRAGFAFKWKDEEAETKLDHIEWSCAAQAITPVAVFDPVLLEGTVVTRASLCNVSECRRLNVGDGSTVTVIKANKIIPKIVAATQGSLWIPSRCPICGAPTAIKISPDSGSEVLTCTNDDCKAKFVSKLTKFVSKHAMNIEGLSEATLQLLYNICWINEFADVYALAEHKNEWKGIAGFGAKSVDKLLTAIEKSRNTSFKNFLYACCIPDIGREQSKVISNYLVESKFPGTTIYEKFLSAMNEDFDFSVIDGIGPVRNLSLHAGWNKNRAEYEKLASCLVFTDGLSKIVVGENSDAGKNGDSAQTCKGLVFVITGDVHHFKNRDAFKEYVEAHGGKVSGSISGKTNFLVSNDTSTGTGKLKKAAELGVKIITEDEFVEKF